MTEDLGGCTVSRNNIASSTSGNIRLLSTITLC